MRKIKVLFLIHDLSVGGAEKVLVNLVNNMDTEKFDITVVSLFSGGVNEQFLKPHVKYRTVFQKTIPGNSKLMKLLSPRQLHRLCINGDYDIEVAYLEGPCARIISGCPNKNTKLVSWIHVEQHTRKLAAQSFRSFRESVECYGRFNQIVAVSQYVSDDFHSIYQEIKKPIVLYNTNETDKILELAEESVENGLFCDGEIKLVGVGKLMPIKGFDRLARIHKHLRDDGLPVHTYVLGIGPEKEKIDAYLKENNLIDTFAFLGYQTNPYKYVKKCDLFVCSSTAEGFSTAATEALIVGTPVCTVEVSGMKEMLGENNEYGVVVPNDEKSLYLGIRSLIRSKAKLGYYAAQAEKRGNDFHKEHTVEDVEKMLQTLYGMDLERKTR